jgi:hypothetical protein
MGVSIQGAIEIKRNALVPPCERNVEQAEGMTQITVLGGDGARRRRRRDPMGGVIVPDKDDVAVGVVATQVTEVQGGTADQQRENGGGRAGKEMVTSGAEPHSLDCSQPQPHCQMSASPMT